MGLAEDTDLLTVLSRTPDEELVHLLNTSPQIVDNFGSGCTEIQLQTIEIFQRYFKCLHRLPTSDLPSCLTFFVQNLNTFFNQNISQVDEALQSGALPTEAGVDRIVEILKQNTRLLTCIEELTRYLGAQQSNVEDIGDTAIEIISLLLTAFRHCRKYENTYKRTDSVVSEHITCLFQKCNDIQCQYFSFLSSLIVDYDRDEQLKSITVILYKIFDIGVAVSNLNLKTMALVWKGFTSLLKSYSTFLKETFDVSKVIQFFCTDITEKIVSMYDADAQFRSLNLKILCFSLKIIVKLCECFTDGLEKSFPHIIQLIFFLYDHSTCAKFCNVTTEISEAIDRYLLAGIDPLISVLICDRGFAKYFVSAETDQIIGNRCELGILLLLSTILEKLISSSEDVQMIWFQVSILNAALNFIRQYHKILCYDLRIATSCANVALPQQIYLYDSLVVNISSVILNCVSCEQFNYVEDMLMTHLLQSPLLVKLFAADVWCVVARFGTSELCLEHVEFLMDLLSEFQIEKTEAVVMSSLIRRLFSFLPSAYQLRVMKSFRSHSLFLELHRVHSKVSELSYQNTIRSIVQDFMTSSAVAKRLGELSLIESLLTVSNDDFVSRSREYLLKQWHVLIDQLAQSKLSSLSQFAVTFTYLCLVTSTYMPMLSPFDILNILQHIEVFLKCESSFIKLNILTVLKALGHCDLNAVDKPQMFQFCCRLGSVFKACLKDGNVIVEQQSIETFTYFSHTTKYLSVIQKTTQNDLQLKENLAAYLKKQPRQPNKNKIFERFILELFEPVLEKKGQLQDTYADNDADEESFPKRLKLNDISDKIDKAESAINDLLINVKSVELHVEQKNRLSSIVKTVNQFQNYL